MRKNKKNKAISMPMEYLGWWIIALVVLIITVTIVMILKGKGDNTFTHLFDFFRSKGK